MSNMIKSYWCGAVAVLLIAVGCSKGSLGNEEGADFDISTTEIVCNVAELGSDWTRGTSIDSESQVGDITIYSTYGSLLYIDNVVASTKYTDDGTWGFEYPRYYPSDNSPLYFWACTPTTDTGADTANGVSYSFSLKETLTEYVSTEEATAASGTKDYTNVLRVNHSVPTIDARNQPDVMVARNIEGKASTGTDLVFEHMLTKITLQAKLDETMTDDDYKDRFYITRFTMQHIATKGELIISEGDIVSTNASGDWIIDQNQRGTVITSTAYTLASPDDEDSKAVALNSTDYKPVMVDSEGNSQALFMIPQRIDNLPTAELGVDHPTVFVMVCDTKGYTNDLGEKEYLYYRTPEIELPTPSNNGWLTGQHIVLLLEFSPSDDDISIVMSVIPTVESWWTHEVDVEIDDSISLWCDVNTAVAGEKINIYSNCSSLTVEGVSITPTSVSNGIYCYEITLSSTTLSVTAKNNAGETLKKIFKFTATNE